MSIADLAHPRRVDFGERVTYKLTVANLGASSATGVQVADTLAAGTKFKKASAGCVAATGVVTCDVGTVASGGSSIVKIVVLARKAGDAINTASVTISETDTDPSNDSAVASTFVRAKVKVSIHDHGRRINGRLRANDVICKPGHNKVVLFAADKRSGAGKKVDVDRTNRRGRYAFRLHGEQGGFFHTQSKRTPNCSMGESRTV